jgi:pyruvate/2-oxoglutarate dehydrogenase complex dihydrolipoamide acyltransferase (E2) component
MTENVNPLPKSKHTLLPLLVILFLVSYGIMSLLVVEQGRTIDAQRHLIRSLFGDSSELSAIKGKIVQDRNERAAQAQANGQAQSQTAPEAKPQSPSAPATPEENARNERKKVGKPAPLRPPQQDTSDTTDARRALISI